MATDDRPPAGELKFVLDAATPQSGRDGLSRAGP